VPQLPQKFFHRPPWLWPGIFSYWERAKATRAYTYARLATPVAMRPGMAFHSDTDGMNTSKLSFAWYNASQIAAEAQMARSSQPDYVTSMNEAFLFMEAFWDPVGGAYRPGFDLDNNMPDGPGQDFVVINMNDDNGLIGNAYLDAIETIDFLTNSGMPPQDQSATRDDYLARAFQIAAFFLSERSWDWLWGGFYWAAGPTHGPGGEPPNKPTNANALAAHFLIRMYEATNRKHWEYLQRAKDALAWIDGHLLDQNGLYSRWLDLTAVDPLSAVDTTKFIEHNAEALEAWIALWRVTGFEDAKTRATDLAKAIRDNLWDANYLHFPLSDEKKNCQGGCQTDPPPIGQLSPALGAIGSRAFIRFFEAFGGVDWLHLAQTNIDTINDTLRQPDGSYSFGACGNNPCNESYKQTVDMATMQQVQVMLHHHGLTVHGL
jgi:hypothetical protein